MAMVLILPLSGFSQKTKSKKSKEDKEAVEASATFTKADVHT